MRGAAVFILLLILILAAASAWLLLLRARARAVTGGAPDLAAVQWEWNQQVASGRALQALQHAVRKVARRELFKGAEVRNVAERMLLAGANAHPPAPGAVHYSVWASVRNAPAARRKAAQELVEKQYVGSEARAMQLIDKCVRVGCEATQNLPTPKLEIRAVGGAVVVECAAGAPAHRQPGERQVSDDGRTVTVPGVGHLLKLGTAEEVATCALRYRAILAGSQHLGLTYEYHRKLHHLLMARNEGFASPLNSRVLGAAVEGTGAVQLCTLFADTDAPFGSIGPFGGARLNRGEVWAVNPPYVITVMDAAWARIRQALADLKDFTCVMLLPAWLDADAVAGATRSEHCKYAVILPKTTQLSTPDGETFPAGFKNVLVFLSNRSNFRVPSELKLPGEALCG